MTTTHSSKPVPAARLQPSAPSHGKLAARNRDRLPSGWPTPSTKPPA